MAIDQDLNIKDVMRPSDVASLDDVMPYQLLDTIDSIMEEMPDSYAIESPFRVEGFEPKAGTQNSGEFSVVDYVFNQTGEIPDFQNPKFQVNTIDAKHVDPYVHTDYNYDNGVTAFFGQAAKAAVQGAILTKNPWGIAGAAVVGGLSSFASSGRQGFKPGVDNEELASQNQSGFFNRLGAFATNAIDRGFESATGTTASLLSTVNPISDNNLYHMVFGDTPFHQLGNNPLTMYLSDSIEHSEYLSKKSKDYLNAGPMEKFFTPEGFSGDIADMLGFTLGMAVSFKALGGMNTLGGRGVQAGKGMLGIEGAEAFRPLIADGVSARILRAATSSSKGTLAKEAAVLYNKGVSVLFGNPFKGQSLFSTKALQSLGKVDKYGKVAVADMFKSGSNGARLMNSFERTALASFGEGRIEASHAYKQAKDAALEDGYSIFEANEIAKSTANTTLGLNLAVLGVTNKFGLNAIIRNKRTLGSLMGRWITREGKKIPLGKVLLSQIPLTMGVGAVREGFFEELGQFTSSEYAEKRARALVDGRSIGFFKEFAKIYRESLTSDEGISNWFGGALFGAVMNGAGYDRGLIGTLMENSEVDKMVKNDLPTYVKMAAADLTDRMVWASKHTNHFNGQVYKTYKKNAEGEYEEDVNGEYRKLEGMERLIHLSNALAFMGDMQEDHMKMIIPNGTAISDTILNDSKLSDKEKAAYQKGIEYLNEYVNSLDDPKAGIKSIYDYYKLGNKEGKSDKQVKEDLEKRIIIDKMLYNLYNSDGSHFSTREMFRQLTLSNYVYDNVENETQSTVYDELDNIEAEALKGSQGVKEFFGRHYDMSKEEGRESLVADIEDLRQDVKRQEAILDRIKARWASPVAYMKVTDPATKKKVIIPIKPDERQILRNILMEDVLKERVSEVQQAKKDSVDALLALHKDQYVNGSLTREEMLKAIQEGKMLPDNKDNLLEAFTLIKSIEQNDKQEETLNEAVANTQKTIADLEDIDKLIKETAESEAIIEKSIQIIAEREREKKEAEARNEGKGKKEKDTSGSNPKPGSKAATEKEKLEEEKKKLQKEKEDKTKEKEKIENTPETSSKKLKKEAEEVVMYPEDPSKRSIYGSALYDLLSEEDKQKVQKEIDRQREIYLNFLRDAFTIGQNIKVDIEEDGKLTSYNGKLVEIKDDGSFIIREGTKLFGTNVELNETDVLYNIVDRDALEKETGRDIFDTNSIGSKSFVESSVTGELFNMDNLPDYLYDNVEGLTAENKTQKLTDLTDRLKEIEDRLKEIQARLDELNKPKKKKKVDDIENQPSSTISSRDPKPLYVKGENAFDRTFGTQYRKDTDTPSSAQMNAFYEFLSHKRHKIKGNLHIVTIPIFSKMGQAIIGKTDEADFYKSGHQAIDESTDTLYVLIEKDGFDTFVIDKDGNRIGDISELETHADKLMYSKSSIGKGQADLDGWIMSKFSNVKSITEDILADYKNYVEKLQALVHNFKEKEGENMDLEEFIIDANNVSRGVPSSRVKEKKSVDYIGMQEFLDFYGIDKSKTDLILGTGKEGKGLNKGVLYLQHNGDYIPLDNKKISKKDTNQMAQYISFMMDNIFKGDIKTFSLENEAIIGALNIQLHEATNENGLGFIVEDGVVKLTKGKKNEVLVEVSEDLFDVNGEFTPEGIEITKAIYKVLAQMHYNVSNNLLKENEDYEDIHGNIHATYSEYLMNNQLEVPMASNMKTVFVNRQVDIKLPEFETVPVNSNNTQTDTDESEDEEYDDSNEEFRGLIIDEEAEAEKEDVEAMRAWLNENLPQFTLEILDNPIYGEHQASITGKLIKLWRDASKGSVYHEGFEAVILNFLTPEEKQVLYDEFRNRPGSFVYNLSGKPYSGKTIMHKDATNHQIKEMLAEGFIAYMEKRELQKNAPVANNFFMKLWNAIKQFFSRIRNTFGSIENYEKEANKVYDRIATGSFRDAKVEKFYPMEEFRSRIVKSNNRRIDENSLKSFMQLLDSRMTDALMNHSKGNPYLLSGASGFSKFFMDTLNKEANALANKLDELSDEERAIRGKEDARNKFELKKDGKYGFDRSILPDLKAYYIDNIKRLSSLDQFGDFDKDAINNDLEREENDKHDQGIKSSRLTNPTSNIRASVRYMLYFTHGVKGTNENQKLTVAPASGPKSIFARAGVIYSKPEPKETYDILLNLLSNTEIREGEDMFDKMMKKLTDAFNVHKLDWIPFLVKKQLQYKTDHTKLSEEEYMLRNDFVNSFYNSKADVFTLLSANDVISISDTIFDTNKENVKRDWMTAVKNLNDSPYIRIDEHGKPHINGKSLFEAYKADKTLPNILNLFSQIGLNLDNYKVPTSVQTELVALLSAAGEVEEMPIYDFMREESSIIGRIAEEILKENSLKMVNSYETAKGTKSFAVTIPSLFTKLINLIDEVDSIEELKEALPHLTLKENDGLVYNLRNNKFLKRGGLIFNNEGKKIQGVHVAEAIISGIKEKDKALGTDYSATTLGTKFIIDINVMLSGLVPAPINSDKSSQNAMSLGKRYLGGKHVMGKDPIPELAKNQYADQLRDELMNFYMLSERDRRNLIVKENIDANFIGFYTDIIGFNETENKKILKELPDNYNAEHVRLAIERYMSGKLGTNPIDKIETHIRSEVNKLKATLKKRGINKDNFNSFLIDKFKTAMNYDQFLLYTTAAKFLSTVDMYNIIQGARINYKRGSADAKRTGSHQSHVQPVNYSPKVEARLNAVHNRLDNKKDRKQLGVMVYKDNIVHSLNLSFIAENMYAFYSQNGSKLTKEEIENRIGAEFTDEGKVKGFKDLDNRDKSYSLSSFAKVNEADAAAYIMPDGFFDLMYMSSKLSQKALATHEWEMAYERQRRSERKDNLKYEYTSEGLKKADAKLTSSPRPNGVMQVLKPVGRDYSGENSLLSMYMKNSTTPLYWSRVENNKILREKYVEWQQNKVDIITFDSGVKTGNVSKDGVSLEDYYQSEALPLRQEIGVMNYGLQVETADKMKTKILRGIQSSKQVLSNVGPHMGDPEVREKVEEYILVLKELINRGLVEAENKLGLKVDTDGSYVIDNPTELVKNMQEQILRLDLPINVSDIFQIGADGKFEYFFDSSLQASTLETILMSMIDKSIVHQDMNGTLVPQLSSFFERKDVTYIKKTKNEDGTFNYEKVSEPVEGEDYILSSSDLKIREDGTLEVKIPSYLKGLYKTGDVVDKRLLTIIGYRIPTQSKAQIDKMIVVDFLDSSYGGAIIVPTEITAKSGSDFDIDKLSLYLPNFTGKGKNIKYIEYLDHNNSDAQQRYDAYIIEREHILYRKMMEDIFTKAQAEYDALEIPEIEDVLLKNENFNKLGDNIKEEYKEEEQRLRSIGVKTLLDKTLSYMMFTEEKIAEERENTVHTKKSEINKKQKSTIVTDLNNLDALRNQFDDANAESNIVALEAMMVEYHKITEIIEGKDIKIEDLRAKLAEGRLIRQKQQDYQQYVPTEIGEESGGTILTLEAFENDEVPMRMQNTKKALQNRYIELMGDLLTMEKLRGETFVPTESMNLEAVYDKLGLNTVNPSYYTASFIGYNTVRDHYIKAKHYVGIVALFVTGHVMRQMSSSHTKKYAFQWIKGTEDGRLDKVNTIDGIPISSLLSEFLTGVVDAGNNPFLLEMNVSNNTIPTILSIISAGGSHESALYLVNSPAVKHLIGILEANDLPFGQVTEVSKFEQMETATNSILSAIPSYVNFINKHEVNTHAERHILNKQFLDGYKQDDIKVKGYLQNRKIGGFLKSKYGLFSVAKNFKDKEYLTLSNEDKQALHAKTLLMYWEISTGVASKISDNNKISNLDSKYSKTLLDNNEQLNKFVDGSITNNLLEKTHLGATYHARNKINGLLSNYLFSAANPRLISVMKHFSEEIGMIKNKEKVMKDFKNFIVTKMLNDSMDLNKSLDLIEAGDNSLANRILRLKETEGQSYVLFARVNEILNLFTLDLQDDEFHNVWLRNRVDGTEMSTNIIKFEHLIEDLARYVKSEVNKQKFPERVALMNEALNIFEALPQLSILQLGFNENQRSISKLLPVDLYIDKINNVYKKNQSVPIEYPLDLFVQNNLTPGIVKFQRYIDGMDTENPSFKTANKFVYLTGIPIIDEYSDFTAYESKLFKKIGTEWFEIGTLGRKGKFVETDGESNDMNEFKLPVEEEDINTEKQYITDEDIKRFRRIASKKAGLPATFATDSSVYGKFYDQDLGNRRGMNQTTEWRLNERNLYDLYDSSADVNVLEDINLFTGKQELVAVKKEVEEQKAEEQPQLSEEELAIQAEADRVLAESHEREKAEAEVAKPTHTITRNDTQVHIADNMSVQAKALLKTEVPTIAEYNAVMAYYDDLLGTKGIPMDAYKQYKAEQDSIKSAFDITTVTETNDIVTAEGTKGAAQVNQQTGEIKIDKAELKKKFEEKAWTNPRKLIETLHPTDHQLITIKDITYRVTADGTITNLKTGKAIQTTSTRGKAVMDQVNWDTLGEGSLVELEERRTHSLTDPRTFTDEEYDELYGTVEGATLMGGTDETGYEGYYYPNGNQDIEIVSSEDPSMPDKATVEDVQKWLNDKYDAEVKATNVQESYAEALPADQFETYEQWEEFVIEHEKQHLVLTREQFDPKGEKTKGEYETEINKRALNVLGMRSQAAENNNSFDTELNNKLRKKLQELYPEIDLNITNNPKWENGDNVMNQKEFTNRVNFNLKVVNSLIKHAKDHKTIRIDTNSQKTNIRKALAKTGTPKTQIDFVFNYMKNHDLTEINTEELASKILAENSFVVEVNTANEFENIQSIKEIEPGLWSFRGDDFYSYSDAIDAKNEYNKIRKEIPTAHYSYLTVPGGINYTENEIATPAITPSIKGHAQFSTDNGIGWFRSDEQVNVINKEQRSFWNPDTQQEEFFEDGTPESTNTRRILEVQSDLFQKGRDKQNITRGNIESFKEVDSFHYDDPETSLKFDGRVINKDGKPVIQISMGEGKYRNLTGSSMSQVEIERIKAFIEPLINLKKYDSHENNFLQLLNKEGNWVNFFLQSIIQNSAKKGYEKVLFPTGDTASKVEGHITLEEFKKQKEDRIKYLEKTITEWNNKKDNIVPSEYFNMNMYNSLSETEQQELIQKEKIKLEQEINGFINEINQLKQELERVETEGISALKPIYNFYENRVANILNKLYDVKKVTDEHGNTWNEISITPEVLSNILLQKDEANNIIGQANIKAMTVLIDSAKQKNDTLPHEYAHHYIAWFRNTPIVQEGIAKWGSEEALVQAIGEQVIAQKGEALGWWKKFVKFLKNVFSKEEIRDLLTDAFLTRRDLTTETKEFSIEIPVISTNQQNIIRRIGKWLLLDGERAIQTQPLLGAIKVWEEGNTFSLPPTYTEWSKEQKDKYQEGYYFSKLTGLEITQEFAEYLEVNDELAGELENIIDGGYVGYENWLKQNNRRADHGTPQSIFDYLAEQNGTLINLDQTTLFDEINLTENIKENSMYNKVISSTLPLNVKEFYKDLTQEQRDKLGDIVTPFEQSEILIEDYEDILKCKL